MMNTLPLLKLGLGLGLGLAASVPLASAAASDMYVFAYTFEPQFCYDQNSYPGCDAPQEYWYTHFTVHGLWPQYQAGGYEHDCTTEAFNDDVIDAIGFDTLTQYWPNVKYAETDPEYTEFWAHEWEKHGTCSGLSQVQYFNSTVAMIESFGTPTIYMDAVGSTIDASALRDSFGGPNFASLQCDSSKYVNGVYTCWDMDSVTHLPTVQIECPSDVQSEDTCTVDTLEVASF
jgi:ribonuclease T2